MTGRSEVAKAYEILKHSYYWLKIRLLIWVGIPIRVLKLGQVLGWVGLT